MTVLTPYHFDRTNTLSFCVNYPEMNGIGKPDHLIESTTHTITCVNF